MAATHRTILRQSARQDDEGDGRFFVRFMIGGVAFIYVPMIALAALAIIVTDGDAAARTSEPVVVEISLSEFAITGDLEVP
jgi:hypothetical protein